MKRIFVVGGNSPFCDLVLAVRSTYSCLGEFLNKQCGIVSAVWLKLMIGVLLLKDKIREIIKNNVPLRQSIGSLEDATDLYSAGMSSHSSVMLMLALENEFNLEFPPNLLNRNVFQSINSIRKAIESFSPAILE